MPVVIHKSEAIPSLVIPQGEPIRKKPLRGKKKDDKRYLDKVQSHKTPQSNEPGKLKCRGPGTTRGSFPPMEKLPPEKRHLVDAYLSKDYTNREMVRIIHEDWGLLKEYSKGTLEQYVSRYKNQVVKPGLVLRGDAKIKSEAKDLILKHVKGSIDVMEELAQLVVAQKSRVKKVFDVEQRTPNKLSNGVSSEIKLLADLVQRYSDTGVEYGLIQVAPKTTRVTQEADGSTTIESQGKQDLMLSLEKSKKLEDAAKHFFDIIEGEFVREEIDG